MSRTTIRAKDGPIVHIRESYAGVKPMVVDREAGIIYGVLVLGTESPNTHGKAGVTGADYELSAHQSLVSLIESRQSAGMNVNKDHQERTNQNRDRRVSERFGWLLKPRIENGRTYADLHTLSRGELLKTDLDTAHVYEAAERNPAAFAMSINGDGHYAIRDRRIKIDRFRPDRHFSVDLVTDGGTTLSLQESNRSKGTKMAISLREAVEKISLKPKATIRLFEMGDGMLKPDAAVDATPEVAADDPDYCVHVGKAIVAILQDDSLTPEDKKKKILIALKLTSDDEEKSGELDTEEGLEPDAPAPPKKEGEEKPEEEEGKKKMKESLDRAGVLMGALKYTPAADVKDVQIAAVAGLTDDVARIKLIESFKGTAPAKTEQKPAGTGPPRSGWAAVRESAGSSNIPATAADQAKTLLGK
jgi:hypothetical protein